ncbi:NAD(P)-dependent dehydrogenase (short-subunit alcohol dehydrogenase family) [Microbacteriaceae bacterium SG_E_30_P1]|uniref:NAD(P)-dependent dehydrogenase (Short-subunit alcohol dehydrogenase family) n=1 Tax=Antiquaquibacter oligotrophicus TaxID=2880260 RepID=A0ABT6KNN1_9MICO|nr:SDR family NAD(P)-dependent oxidoreductase [Antiquaquibacter oligotrophicus]MDH6180774.1 NAD(P)-dependent dehydrogenase (short-subunit alcohol dehydrogenase family) [Antiquaquibacter oligotrophicus]UDF13507.1 SDR family oxidoreductase [Antiquaquibacter oligotrophicus]
MDRLTGKVVVITGASGGLGFAGAELMAREGARLVMAGRSGSVDERASVLRDRGFDVTTHIGDVSNPDDVRAMIETAMKTYGRIDALWNNAGLVDAEWILADTDVVDMSFEHFTKTIEVNTGSVFLGAKYAIPAMIASGGGSIINTSSLQGHAGDTILTAYGTSKAAMNYLTQSIATGFGRKGIRANVIAPGLIPPPSAGTPQPGHRLEAVAAVQMVLDSQLLATVGEPSDVANAAVFLASDESRFITGQTLYVDGGFTAHQPTYADRLRSAH